MSNILFWHCFDESRNGVVIVRLLVNGFFSRNFLLDRFATTEPVRDSLGNIVFEELLPIPCAVTVPEVSLFRYNISPLTPSAPENAAIIKMGELFLFGVAPGGGFEPIFFDGVVPLDALTLEFVAIGGCD